MPILTFPACRRWSGENARRHGGRSPWRWRRWQIAVRTLAGGVPGRPGGVVPGPVVAAVLGGQGDVLEGEGDLDADLLPALEDQRRRPDLSLPGGVDELILPRHDIAAGAH